MKVDTSTPVLLIGGQENALAVARNLGRRGISVRVSGGPACWGMRSRYCCQSFPIPDGQDPGGFWQRLLLSTQRRDLDGHILFALSDDAIEFLVDHHPKLQERYILDDSVPDLQHAMLDKKRTLELARSVGVPTPRFWPIDKAEDVEKIRDNVMFPVMVKPIHSFRFAAVFEKKLFIIESSFAEVVEKVHLARQHGLDVMVVEMIPGADDLLNSYYTYIDSSGRHLFHYTKRILRRYPVNRGGACYHITEWLPETVELGRRFFDAIGWRGMANIEFKRDLRDGKLKVIEVNPRFTAAHRLIVQSGAPIDLMIYCALTGQDGPHFDTYKQHLRFWYPMRDFLTFCELNKSGKLTFIDWVRSVLCHRQVLPLFSVWDPMPSLTAAVWYARAVLRRLGQMTRR